MSRQLLALSLTFLLISCGQSDKSPQPVSKEESKKQNPPAEDTSSPDEKDSSSSNPPPVSDQPQEQEQEPDENSSPSTSALLESPQKLEPPHIDRNYNMPELSDDSAPTTSSPSNLSKPDVGDEKPFVQESTLPRYSGTCLDPNLTTGDRCADNALIVDVLDERLIVSEPLACLDTEEAECQLEKDELRLKWNEAAQFCDALDIADINDWRLPSREELAAIYCQADTPNHYEGYPQSHPDCEFFGGKNNLLSGFVPKGYWSETESLGYAAYQLNFDSGYEYNTFKVFVKRHFRCVAAPQAK